MKIPEVLPRQATFCCTRDMKGKPALRMLDAIVEAIAANLPASVRKVRTRLAEPGGLFVWAVPSAVPDEIDYEFWGGMSTDTEIGVGQRGIWLPWGYGTWLPLPGRLRKRLDAACALETVQEAVQVVEPSWPAPDATAKARVEGDETTVWFENASGQPVFPLIKFFSGDAG
jgi:hypothetical protein